MNIIIIFAILILLGIIVGSNLFPTMTVVILSQPTVALPIGVWLTIAIGAGLLSSLLIQLIIFIDRRSLQRQLRQLQSRTQQPDEDIFTYTSSPSEADNSAPDRSTTPTKTSRFKSYRSKLTDRFTNEPSTPSTPVDRDDDWGAEPAINRQLDWEDSPPPSRQQDRSSDAARSTIENDFPSQTRSQNIYPDPYTAKNDSAPPTSRAVYDADFRLIQPPYKQPLATEFDDNHESFGLEDTDTNQAEDDARSRASVKPTSPPRYTPSNNLDDEDWGFDFDSQDAPVRKK